jgi:hypothetical protein
MGAKMDGMLKPLEIMNGKADTTVKDLKIGEKPSKTSRTEVGFELETYNGLEL